uniref:FYVE-type domain-containing protein n=1 Tax=Globisporangium ultimum (strain ATCC 200006 / CBS 805.95 / DAOM BR144) TaxID=431595 RepID=K3X3U3_GLOUD
MTSGPVLHANYFGDEIPMLAAPRSVSTATSVRTRERDPEIDTDLEASYFIKPEDNMLRMRASRSDISSAKLKTYHELCNKRLECTLQMFRLREERERAAIARGTKKQRVSANPAAASSFSPSSNNFEARDRQWKLIRESNDVRVYRHVRRKQHTSTMMANGTIHGSLNDVMNGLYADTTKDAQVLNTLLGSNFIDAGVLHVDRCGDDQEPFQFSGITWTALKTPGLFFCKNRDLLCFKVKQEMKSKMDTFKDDLGDEFGYMVLQSIDATDDCSRSIANQASHYVRGYISIAILFKKQDNDLVNMYMHGEFNSKGRISSMFGDVCFANSIIAMANTAQSGQAKNLSMLLHSFSAAPGAIMSQMLSKSEKDRCGVCARSMFFWDSPQQCRGCWQRTCRSCRVKKPIFCANYHRSHTGGKKSQAPCTEIFCLQCVTSVIPSGVQTKAKLLKQLEKKRKRSGSLHRQTISSTITDSSAIRAAYQASAAGNIPDEDSSISAMSFGMESEKHQRLSLSRQAGRKTPRPKPSSMVDVVEHYEIQNSKQPKNISGAASSSMPSLISFSSNDAGTISDYGAALTASSTNKNRDPADYRLGSRQYHMDVLAAGLKRTPVPAERRDANVNLRAAGRPPRNDEYYNKVLQRYLRSNRSYISINSNVSSALTNGSSQHALTDREDASVSTGSVASVDVYNKYP